MLKDMSTSLKRTYVPIAVGALISWLSTRGLEVSDETATALVVTMTGFWQAAYYTTARLVETRYPQLGFLLGSKQQPKYNK